MNGSQLQREYTTTLHQMLFEIAATPGDFGSLDLGWAQKWWETLHRWFLIKPSPWLGPQLSVKVLPWLLKFPHLMPMEGVGRLLTPMSNSSTPVGGVLQVNSILTLSTWRERQVPQGKGSVLQDCTPPPRPDASRKSWLLPALLTHWL